MRDELIGFLQLGLERAEQPGGVENHERLCRIRKAQNEGLIERAISSGAIQETSL